MRWAVEQQGGQRGWGRVSGVGKEQAGEVTGPGRGGPVAPRRTLVFTLCERGSPGELRV